jgi:hypothetical protein
MDLLVPIQEQRVEEDFEVKPALIQTFAENSTQVKQDWKIKRIIAADDQIINIQVLDSYFSELSLSDRVGFASNGQEVIDLVKDVFNDGLATHREGVYKPINLIISDFQMPYKNGF